MELTEQEKKQIHALLKGYAALVIKFETYEEGNSLKSIQSKVHARNTLLEAIQLIAKKLPVESELKNVFEKNKKTLTNKRISQKALSDFKIAFDGKYYNHSLEYIMSKIFDDILAIEETLPSYTTTDLFEHFFQNPEDIFKMMLFQLHHILHKKNPRRIWPLIIEIVFLETEFEKYFNDKKILEKFVDYPKSINLNKINHPPSQEYFLKKRLLDKLRQWRIQSKKFNHSPLLLGSES